MEWSGAQRKGGLGGVSPGSASSREVWADGGWAVTWRVELHTCSEAVHLVHSTYEAESSRLTHSTLT